MADTVLINTGEYAVGNKNNILETGSIGSCVVILIYDPTAKIGGLAHSMLPARRELDPQNSLSAKYVNEAVELLVREVLKMGGRRDNLISKLVGGAKMFRYLTGDDKGIGFQNVLAAKEELVKYGIPIMGEETGGTGGRSLKIDLDSGYLEVRSTL